MEPRVAVLPLLAACCILLSSRHASAERSYEDQRFTARYDICNDRGRFVLSHIDDGDCQVLCGPSGDIKLLRLEDGKLCKNNEGNIRGICKSGRCVAAPESPGREVTTRRPIGLQRSTTKFVPSTVAPITSGFTYSWQKWRTYSPSTKSPSSQVDSSSTKSSTPPNEVVQ